MDYTQPLLDRCLERWEHVHHVDGDRANNSPRNLRVMDIREHTAHAFTRGPLLAYCAWCGDPFLRAGLARVQGQARCRKHAVLAWRAGLVRMGWGRPVQPIPKGLRGTEGPWLTSRNKPFRAEPVGSGPGAV